MEYIIIGEIINTHGIKGELKIYPLTDNIDRFKDLSYVYLGRDKVKAKLEVAREHKGFIILKLEEFQNINEVLEFKGQYLYVDFEERMELPEDNYYIFEIIGLDAVDMDENPIGRVSDVIEAASNDVYIIDGINGKQSLIPAVKEFVKKVDLDRNLIYIDPIEGMIE